MTIIHKPITPAAVAANRENSHKSTGPRTALGKRRASRNAEKHLVYAHLTPARLKELGETASTFEALRRSLHEAFDPRDGFERELVEDMTGIKWRLSRLHRAEAGILATQKRGFQMDRQLGTARREAGLGAAGMAELLKHGKFGIIGAAGSAEDCRRALALLGNVREEAKLGIFAEDSATVLEAVYGEQSGADPHYLVRLFKECCAHPESGRSEEQDSHRDSVVTLLDEQIKRIEEIQSLLSEKERDVLPCREDSRLMLEREDLDKIVRYESHLERLFERKLQQFVAWRRARVGGGELAEGGDEK